MQSLATDVWMAGLIFRREISARLTSIWFFIVASAVCLIAWIYGAGFQSSFDTESIVVTADPLRGLDILVVGFLGLVLGLRLAASIAWEREHGTMEVLLVGPVRWRVIIAAKFLVELCVLVVTLAIYWLYLLLGQPLGAGVIRAADTGSIALMPVFPLPLMGLGLLISAWARTVRAAVIAFVVLTGLLAAFEIFHGYLLLQPADDMSLTALYVRDILETAEPVVRPISAMSHLATPAEALLRQGPLRPGMILAAIALTAVTLAASLLVAWRRGA
ncbi:ABC transporter permease subunit [Amorphus orientalis]|uniref:ABC-type transport system involved in multi-copper enzyme maturation permease subunit n=1 Tax=Amorphus orientalis TaxID=649198 RepID=A0AAE4AT22_9HYPH|nr:ABC transporter permease subunit [Amorphus orientalis]MDQ0315898.1 ABC-type transport system involved in multi-copper enzyme maturation permease subunit [Amorphus orientalis]